MQMQEFCNLDRVTRVHAYVMLCPVIIRMMDMIRTTKVFEVVSGKNSPNLKI